MKKLKKKSIIIISSIAISAVALSTVAIILAINTNWLNATVIDVSEKHELIKDSIIAWDSSTKIHEKTASSESVKCSIELNDNKYEYENFTEGWVEATTTYKSRGELTFTFYSDWIAEDGIFGTDEGTKGTSFINGSGGLLIKEWGSNITIDFNGYKIDRNLKDTTTKYGTVIKVDEGKNISFKNGCITGGANTDDGGGVLIYGQPSVYFTDMTVTGNFSGYNGGGIYIGSHSYAYFNNLDVEGNYAEHYGGGVYVDYKSAPGSLRISRMYNKVLIQNNLGLDGRNNLTFCASKGDDCAQISGVNLSDDSVIYVSLSRRDRNLRYILHSKFNGTSNFKYFKPDDSDWVVETNNILMGGGTLETVAQTFDVLTVRQK